MDGNPASVFGELAVLILWGDSGSSHKNRMHRWPVPSTSALELPLSGTGRILAPGVDQASDILLLLEAPGAGRKGSASVPLEA